MIYKFDRQVRFLQKSDIYVLNRDGKRGAKVKNSTSNFAL